MCEDYISYVSLMILSIPLICLCTVCETKIFPTASSNIIVCHSKLQLSHLKGLVLSVAQNWTISWHVDLLLQETLAVRTRQS
jgi:hypothetical protein